MKTRLCKALVCAVRARLAGRFADVAGGNEELLSLTSQPKIVMAIRRTTIGRSSERLLLHPVPGKARRMQTIQRKLTDRDR